MRLARNSLLLLLIQLGLVSTIAAKYLIDRATSPRIWTRAAAYDPSLIMRGRYISARLKIDVCGIKLPIARMSASFPQNTQTLFDLNGTGEISGQLPIIAGVQQGKLVALRIAKSREERNSQQITLRKDAACDDAVLWTPVDFYLSEAAKSPFPLQKGQELWVEVTVPSAGPPRPISLALKSADGQWQPLNYR